MSLYSADLRQKVLDVHRQGNISQRQLARRFSVSLSFVQNLLKRYRQTGTITPKAHAGGRVAKLNTQHLQQLDTLVAQNNDATLEQLCDLLECQTQVRLSRSSMGRWVQYLKLTYKKNPARQ